MPFLPEEKAASLQLTAPLVEGVALHLRNRPAPKANFLSSTSFSMQIRLPALTLLPCILVLQGCAYPKVVKYYDEECQIMAKRMELDVANVRVAQSCENDSCLLSLATGLAFSATSIVISGSVVQIGNALYWKERNRKCKRGEAYVPGDAPAPSPAASSAA